MKWKLKVALGLLKGEKKEWTFANDDREESVGYLNHTSSRATLGAAQTDPGSKNKT